MSLKFLFLKWYVVDEIHVGPMAAELCWTATVLQLLVTNFALQNQIQAEKQLFLVYLNKMSFGDCQDKICTLRLKENLIIALNTRLKCEMSVFLMRI